MHVLVMSSEACYKTFVQQVMEHVWIIQEPLETGSILQDVIVVSNYISAGSYQNSLAPLSMV